MLPPPPPLLPFPASSTCSPYSTPPVALPSPGTPVMPTSTALIPASPTRQAESIAFDKIIIQKQGIIQHTPLLNSSHTNSSYRKPPIIQQTRPRQTNPIIWCLAILCLLFSLLLIFFGIATLIIFLVVRPRNPVFDIPNASLSTIYFDSPEYVNGDFTFLANFTNPNQKVDVRFEYAIVELFFADRLIANQAIQPFSQRRREARIEPVHLISSLVYLPQSSGLVLRRQVQNNKVIYNIRGTFRVRASLGIIHYSYWLHSRCQLVMTSPPTGVLVARSCRTNR